MANRIEVELPCEFSDGSSSKWPASEYVWAPADTLYREKLADLGKELIEGSLDGKSYFCILQSLISCRENDLFRKAMPVAALTQRV
jgi:hypothetical protein